MSGEDAVELCGLLRPRTVIPVHYEGWSHFQSGAGADHRRPGRCSAWDRGPLPLADAGCAAPAAGVALGVQAVGQLPAGGHAELLEDLAQVVVDGVRADEQVGGDLGVGTPGRGQARDRVLLRGEFERPGGVERSRRRRPGRREARAGPSRDTGSRRRCRRSAEREPELLAGLRRRRTGGAIRRRAGGTWPGPSRPASCSSARSRLVVGSAPAGPAASCVPTRASARWASP